MCKPFKPDSVALITGASRGIGEAIALRLAKEGVCVGLLARNTLRLEALAEKIVQDGGQSIVLGGDVSSEESWKSVVNVLRDRFGKLDILINNAGRLNVAPIQVGNFQDWEDTFQVNFWGAVKGVKTCLPLMARSSTASIVNITSVMALVGDGGISIYAASKGALISWTRSMAVELAPRGIRVNAVALGIVETDLVRGLIKKIGKNKWAQLQNSHLLGLGSPQDAASAVAFLSSSEAKWITGSVFVVDGGFTAYCG